MKLCCQGRDTAYPVRIQATANQTINQFFIVTCVDPRRLPSQNASTV